MSRRCFFEKKIQVGTGKKRQFNEERVAKALRTVSFREMGK